MELHDISLGLQSSLATWPGDTPFRFTVKAKMAEGATVNIGAASMGVHNGTHVDAPFHFTQEGKTADQLSLETFFGPALVVDLTGIRESITRRELEPFHDEIIASPRLLLKTGAWTDHAIFPRAIPVLDEAAAEWLGSIGLLLLGVDLPSVDAIESHDLPNHHTLARGRVAILESVSLVGIAAGCYQLAALPLKIIGGDAAPVRAILWR